MKWMENWCITHPDTTVVRFTSMFYNFVWIWGADERKRNRYTDWGSYDFTMSERALDEFKEEYGYSLTAEDFINQGKLHVTHMPTTKEKRDWMDFVNRFVVNFGKKLIDITQKYGKKAYVFYDDSWVGIEPYGERFQQFGFDGIIKCVFNGYEVRLCGNVPADTHEIRLHPYLFPVGLGGAPTFMEGGNPTLDAKQYWVNIRRALLREPIQRIGLGGYLHLTENFPDFQDYIEKISGEFRIIQEYHKAGRPYVIKPKVAVLHHWGKLRSWTLSGHFHETYMHDLIHVIEALSGLPIDVDFISFEDVKNGWLERYDIVINAGRAGDAWSGGDSWKEEAVVSALYKWVYEGGAFIGIGQPSAVDGFDSFYRMAPVLGIDEDTGAKVCHGKWEFQVETVKGLLPKGCTVTPVERRFLTDGKARVIAAPGGYFPGGNYIYTKAFQLPEEDLEKTVLLEIEGAYHKTRVYCNGAFVTSCMNGYRGFYAELTPHLTAGENVLEIKVANSDSPNSRWYSGSGIYRPVSLLLGSDIYIKPDGLKMLTPDVAEDISTVEVALDLAYYGKKSEAILIQTIIRDASGRQVASEKTKVTVFPEELPLIRQRIYVRDTKLWSVEEPNLYHCEVTVYCGDQVMDREEAEFGFRHVQADPLHGLRINGKKVLLRGACIHHDNGVIGAISMPDAEVRKIRIMKEAGFNAVRIAHNSASKATLTACDREGMLVIEESFDMWNFSKTANDYALLFAESWKEDVKAIVAKDYNHPSVIMYSIGNEIQELGTPAGAAWNRKIAEFFHTLDSSRFVTNAVNGLLTVMDKLSQIIQDSGVMQNAGACAESSGESQGGSGDINDVMTALMGHGNELSTHKLVAGRLDEVFSALDISGYNYMRGRYEQDAGNYPNRITYGSETYGPDIDLNWKCVKEISNVIGDFTWTGWDYIGEAGIGVVGHDEPGGFASGYPTYLAYTGDIDITGHRRPISYYREIVWGLRKDPYIAVQHPQYYEAKVSCTPWVVNDSVSSWTWSGQEGKACIVEVYSDAEEVELFLNDQSIGKKPAGEKNRYKAFFETMYRPGTLEAVSYENGIVTGRHQLQTAGEELRLQIICENGGKNDSDLVYLPIEITDKNGILQTSSDRRIDLSIDGTGELLGFGSGNPKSEEDFTDAFSTTWNGKALAVLRRIGDGTIRVQAACEGTEPIHIEI